MKYPFIAALVPTGEHFDESAIVNEGGWVTTTHLAAVEASLATRGALQTSLDAATGTITSRDATIAQMTTAAANSASTITEQAAKITALQAQVVALGRRPSGTGTPVAAGGADPVVEKAPVPSYADDANPANKWADEQLRKNKFSF